jgi:DNA-binding NtrC family response regulator
MLNGKGVHTTLVFDNVDELPRAAQAEVRRFLNDHEEHRHQRDDLGHGNRLRVVSTSRKPLSNAVQAGYFRDDLFYLLTVSSVFLPPLRKREHPEVLAQALCAQLTGRTITFSPEAKDALCLLPFFGNVRELRGVLQNALATARDNRINRLDLQQALFGAPLASAIPETACTIVPANPVPAYNERSVILDALANSRWNVSEAARVLGMGRATINRKLKFYEIRRPT